MNYIKNIRNAALYSPYEIKVRDLTSNDPFAGNAQKARKDVADATNNYESFLMTMRVLWERMNDTGKNWRHVYKGLQLLEYLLVYGHENVVHDAKNNIGKVKILRSFSYVDEQTFNDYGEGVRRLAERVLSTLGDDSKLEEYRNLAEKGQFQGFPKLTEPSKFAQKTGTKTSEKPQQRRYEEDERPQRRYEDDEDERPRRKMEPIKKQQQPRYDSDEDEPVRKPQRQQQQRYDSEEEEEKPRQRQQQPPPPQQQQQQRQKAPSYDEHQAPLDRPNQSGLDFFFDDEVEIAFTQGSQQRQQPQQSPVDRDYQRQPQQKQQQSPVDRDYQRQQPQQQQQQQQQYYEEPVVDPRGSREELLNARADVQRLLSENESMKAELADTKQKYEQLWKSLESSRQ
jgi:epsin